MKKYLPVVLILLAFVFFVSFLFTVKSIPPHSSRNAVAVSPDQLFVMDLDSGRKGLLIEVENKKEIGKAWYLFWQYLSDDAPDKELELTDYDSTAQIGYSATYISNDSGFTLEFFRLNDKKNFKERFSCSSFRDSLRVSYGLTADKDDLDREQLLMKDYDQYVVQRFLIFYNEVLKLIEEGNEFNDSPIATAVGFLIIDRGVKIRYALRVS